MNFVLILIVILWIILLVELQVKATSVQVEECGYDELMVNSDNTSICLPCPRCPLGHGMSVPCGSIVPKEESINCKPCQRGTYSNSDSILGCKPCTKCKSNEHVLRNCTRESDTICFEFQCREGFYFNTEIMSCLPCCRCCNDGNDVKIDECMTKESIDHCSFESSKHCQHYRVNQTLTVNGTLLRHHQLTNFSILMDINNINNSYQHPYTRTTQALTNVPLIILALTLCIIIGVVVLLSIAVLFLKTKAKRDIRMNRHKMVIGNDKSGAISEEEKRYNGCFTIVRSQNKRLSHVFTSKDNQSDDLNDFAKYDGFSSLYIFNCLVYIRHDKTSTIDGARNLLIEILDDDTNLHLRIIEPGYMFISPIFKFYSHGTEFEKPVEICFPHSALIDSGVKNWDIKVLCIDEREKHKSKWKEIESEVSIEWNNIKFYTKTLLTYAVVGKPITSAKKRMQFALFSMQKMISDRLEMTLYLLDESKSCLDRVIKENKNKGWEMLGCLYAVFIDFCNPVDIIINIEELIEPWSLVHLKDEVISSQLLRDSYFNIPSVHAVFRRSERRATTFSCHFRVAIGGSEIIIPAVTFVPEELMCVFVDVHNEDPSLSERQTLLRDVSYDQMYQMCRKLDIPARGRGQWRDVGRHFGVSEADLQSCCKEYASIDGSPSRALMEFILSQRPKLTVGEFIKFLDEYGRGDVVSVLSKVK